MPVIFKTDRLPYQNFQMSFIKMNKHKLTIIIYILALSLITLLEINSHLVELFIQFFIIILINCLHKIIDMARKNLCGNIIGTIIVLIIAFIYFQLTNKVQFSSVQYEIRSPIQKLQYQYINQKYIIDKSDLTQKQLDILTISSGNYPNDFYHNGQYLFATFDQAFCKIFANGTIQNLVTTQEGINFGLVLTKNQQLAYFFNSQKGIIEVNLSDFKIKLLVDSYNGFKFTQVLSMAINKEGTELYFTQSSSLVTSLKQNVYKEISLRNPLGKIYKLNIQTRVVSVVADGLYFPWGIVLEQNQDSVLVSETSKHRITRVSLQSFNNKRVIMSDLQGFPSGLSLDKSYKLWITFYDHRGFGSDLIDCSSFWKWIIINLPPSFTQDVFYGSHLIGGIQVDLRKYPINNKVQIDNYLFVKAGQQGYFWNNFWRNKLKRICKIIEVNGNIYMSSWLYSQIFKVNKQEYIKKRGAYHREDQTKQQF